MENREFNPPPSRDALARRGVSAAAHFAGGLFFLAMALGARVKFLGIILPPAALVLGICALFSKDRDGKKTGCLLSAAGALGLIVRFGFPALRPFAGFALGLGAVGLFAAGIWEGARFLFGLNSLR